MGMQAPDLRTNKEETNETPQAPTSASSCVLDSPLDGPLPLPLPKIEVVERGDPLLLQVSKFVDFTYRLIPLLRSLACCNPILPTASYVHGESIDGHYT